MTAQSVARRVVDAGIERLAMPDQRLDESFSDPAAAAKPEAGFLRGRIAIMLVPPLLCGLVVFLLLVPLQGAGLLSPSFWFLCIAVLLPFYWDAVAVTLSILGLFWRKPQIKGEATPLQVAILVLLFDEPPEPVIAHAVRLLSCCVGSDPHRFSLHVLSDSRQPQSEQRERAIFNTLKRCHAHRDMFYVHRASNIDYKSGNIRSWITSSGHSYDAMLVLDADSVMDSQSVVAMANALSADPSSALVQSLPRVLSGRTLWQSMLSFASNIYGLNLGKGLSLASGGEANSYGHNALLRIRAFATSAGLPHLAGEPPFGGVIMSHDFVEAALLRRAGWRVRFIPEVAGSFEDTPETLAGFLARDRRWCHGNLQHLSLLSIPGLAVMSRFHLLQGAMTYLNAPLWLAALLLWTLVPVQAGPGGLLWPVMVIALVLLLPRLCGLLSAFKTMSRSDLIFAAQELALSSLLTPALMVQRTRMILSILLGKPSVWSKPSSEQNSMFFQMQYFGTELVLGLVLLVAWCIGQASPLILTAAVPLLLSPLLAQLVSRRRTHAMWSSQHENE